MERKLIHNLFEVKAIRHHMKGLQLQMLVPQEKRASKNRLSLLKYDSLVYGDLIEY